MNLLDTGRDGLLRDLGLLALRLGFGLTMALHHGWGKVVRLGEGGGFPDPLGIGATPSLALAALGEFVGGLLVAAGLMGRSAALLPACTMFVAFFVHHAGDPLGEAELALVYLIGFAALAATGPGKLSVDGLLRRR